MLSSLNFSVVFFVFLNIKINKWEVKCHNFFCMAGLDFGSMGDSIYQYMHDQDSDA